MKPTRGEIRALCERDPALGRALRELPRFPGFPEEHSRRSTTHYGALARAIVFQQLHSSAATRIFERVVALSGGARFPDPPKLLALPDDRLLGAGLSRNKLRALRDLAERVHDGRLELADVARKSDAAIVDRLTSVHGIGEWSAHMFLIFRLGRLDVLADGDLAVREGVRILDGLASRPSAAEIAARAEVWRPLRSVACWVLWRAVERERAQERASPRRRPPSPQRVPPSPGARRPHLVRARLRR